MEEQEKDNLETNTKTSNKFIEFYKKHKDKFNLSYVVIFSLIVAKLITSFVFTSSLVVGKSMSPTLENGDKGLSDALFFKMGKVKRFDIVVVDLGEDLLVKRIIGLPNETIQYLNGVLKINGKVVEENFISQYVAKKTGAFNQVLGDNEYFVMGDNRGNSYDSRQMGPIKYSQIQSRGLLVFSKCKTVEDGQCKGLKLVWPYKP